ncbi:MAG: tripartite tricarboxylate transporter substrate binding protein [Pseudomonadota bacterium]|nr:tripartite tricarboxylate transporter substrate binding protein [Pseudomonadota bacterium]
MLQRRRFLSSAVVPVWAAFGAPSANAAESFATKTIKLIVAGPPAGTTDALARLIAADLPALLGQSAIVENRPGAGGIIGTREMIDAPADGQTLLLGHVATNAIDPALYHPKPYDAITDFMPISPVGTAPDLLVVSSSNPARTLAELLAQGRKSGNITYGSPGVGLPQHFFGYMLSKESGVPMLHVPYKGSAPALTDLLGGRITMMFVTSGAAAPFVRSGQVRALAVATQERSPFFPQVPTVKEQGFPGVAQQTWFGLFAPARTPPGVGDELNVAVGKILTRPDFRSRLEELFIQPAKPETRKRYAAFIQSEAVKWVELVRQSGITAG